MMGKKKLWEIKAQLEALSDLPPGKPAKADAAKADTKRTELKRLAKKPPKPKARRRPVKLAINFKGGQNRSADHFSRTSRCHRTSLIT